MYLARDPFTQDTAILDDAWPWAFLAIEANPRATLNDVILARLTDHCAACGTMRDGVSHWRGTVLPINSIVDASTGIPDEAENLLDLLPFLWHDEILTTVDEETEEFLETALHDAIRDEVGLSFSRAVSEPPPCLKAPFTPPPSTSALMRLPAELRSMVMEELWQPTASDAYGCSLGTTRKDGLISTENSIWVVTWAKVRGTCTQLRMEADAHIVRWVRCHDISVHAWDLTGTLDMPMALFAQITRLTVFFDVMDMIKADIDLEPTKINFPLLQNYYKALHSLAMMPRLTSLTIRWRADSADSITDDIIKDLQHILVPDVFQTLCNCSPTDMECLESVFLVGFDPEVLEIDELCDWVRADEKLRALKISFIGSAKAEYVV